MKNISEVKIIKKAKIEGDLILDCDVVFENDIEITGHLKANNIMAKKNIHVHKTYTAIAGDIVGESQKVGGSQEVGESQKIKKYLNSDFSILNEKKIDVELVCFTNNESKERIFWKNQLRLVSGTERLQQAVSDGNMCWDEILTEAAKFKEKLLKKNVLHPALQQAIKIMLKKHRSYKMKKATRRSMPLTLGGIGG